MVRTEQRELHGVMFDYSYSDAGMQITCNGEVFDEAYDVLGSGRTYTETDIPIDGVEDNIIAELLEEVKS